MVVVPDRLSDKKNLLDTLNIFPVYRMLNTIRWNIVHKMHTRIQEQLDHVDNAFDFYRLDNNIRVYIEYIDLCKDIYLMDMKLVQTIQLKSEAEQ